MYSISGQVTSYKWGQTILELRAAEDRQSKGLSPVDLVRGRYENL